MPWTPDKSNQLDMVYSWLILLVAAGLVHMHAYTPTPITYSPLPLQHAHTHIHILPHNVELHYTSSVISAVMLRSYCSLAMLSCPWTTQPHIACQLAHTDREKKKGNDGKSKKKKKRKRERDASVTETRSERSLTHFDTVCKVSCDWKQKCDRK